MKNIILILLTALTLSCCDKDDNKPIAEIDKLPPTTQTGANTAGCLVNGKAFLPKGNLQTKLVCQYVDGVNFSIGIGEKINDKIRYVSVISYNYNLIVGETYQLKEYGANSKFGEYVIYNPDFSEIHYKTNIIINGELKITHHNFDKAFICGTFWFDAINSDGEKVQIREGRFDMKY